MQQLKQLGVANISVRIAKRFERFAGRLCLFKSNREKIRTDQWVLDAIQGYQIEWTAQPSQQHCPPCPQFSKEETVSLNTEIHQMLEKDAISPITTNLWDGYFSSIFLVPKKDGGTDQ